MAVENNSRNTDGPRARSGAKSGQTVQGMTVTFAWTAIRTWPEALEIWLLAML
jgi:hypothetical protein